MPVRSFILPVIVVAQFLCTSLWFAGNAVLADLAMEVHIAPDFLAHLTSAVQFGFITGTLVVAVLTIADRYSPSKVFFWSAVLAAVCNAGIILQGIGEVEILFFRVMTGFFLAGVYPVGMKIASDYYRNSLGTSLGYLVGALVLGTAFPHLLKDLIPNQWTYVVYGTSILSVLGGIMILLFVPDGPYRKAGSKLSFTQCMHGFREAKFRSAAFGYFGHMWEVYTFWAFVPVMIHMYNSVFPDARLNVPLFSFLIIASGGVACVPGGIISRTLGSAKTAKMFLSISFLCCLLSPLFLLNSSSILFLIFLLIWGMAVVPDSPLFSSLVAIHAPEVSRGSAITIVTCIGFSITIISMQLLGIWINSMDHRYVFMMMGIGPALGLLFLRTKE
jgi:MFS family permease